MAIDLMMVASAGLVQLALSGSPNLLIQELNGAGTNNERISRNDFSATAGGFNPTSDLFVSCNSDGTTGREYLAPAGVELQLGDNSEQDGSKWAMFEPFHYSDHFIIEYADGRLERWDVGNSEGDNIPFRVQVVNNQVMRMDGSILPPNRGSCVSAGQTPVIIRASAAVPGKSNNPGNGGGGGSGVGLAVGGVAVVGIAVYLLSGGTAADVSFAPDYGLHYTEDGGTEYFYGAKWEYEKDNWRADWTAMRARKSESWRYASGVEWTAGALRATFGGENTGDKTAINLSLAAERRAGGWMLQSAANANARFDEFGGEFAHRFSAAASRRVSEWKVSVSAAARDLDDNPALRADMIFTREF